jgi:hypothetical protein
MTCIVALDSVAPISLIMLIHSLSLLSVINTDLPAGFPQIGTYSLLTSFGLSLTKLLDK